MTITTILAERGRTHGDFDAVAAMFAKLCEAAELDAASMDPRAFTSIAMTLMKIARARCGTEMHEDHPRDIEGYARLWADACHDTRSAA